MRIPWIRHSVGYFGGISFAFTIVKLTFQLIGNLNFYVKVELPFKVVQNELIILSPLVFNYLDKDLNVSRNKAN